MMRNIKVLLIEDDEEDIILIRKQLQRFRIFLNLEVAHTAEEGLAYLDNLKQKNSLSSTPLIILLDLNLPRMSGLEFLRIIKNDDKLKMVPVIMLTTSELQRDVSCAYEYGVNSYITKPGDLKQYMRVIEALEGFWFTVVKLP